MYTGTRVVALLSALVAASPLAVRQSNSGSLTLWVQSNDTTLHGRLVSEATSTDDGPTLVVLAPKNDTSMQISGFIMSGDFLVNYPIRSGGSEFDGWVVNAANSSGLATPQVVPAGSTGGFVLRNATTGSATQKLLGFEAASKAASFLACEQTFKVGQPPVQQLLFSFDALVPAGCQAVDLVASQ